MENETKRQVALQINYLGDSEYALALSRVKTKDVAAIVEAIQQHRKQFEDGKVASIGSAIFASQEQWQAIAGESERAARDILLGSSSELSELDRIEKAALEAKRLADAKNRELHSLWSDFQSIPDKAASINAKLASLKADRDSLDLDRLHAIFSEHYKKVLSGVVIERTPLDLHSGVIATRQLRLDRIGQLEGELRAQLAELTARSKVLAKKLGQKSNI